MWPGVEADVPPQRRVELWLADLLLIFLLENPAQRRQDDLQHGLQTDETREVTAAVATTAAAATAPRTLSVTPMRASAGLTQTPAPLSSPSSKSPGGPLLADDRVGESGSSPPPWRCTCCKRASATACSGTLATVHIHIALPAKGKASGTVSSCRQKRWRHLLQWHRHKRGKTQRYPGRQMPHHAHSHAAAGSPPGCSQLVTPSKLTLGRVAWVAVGSRIQAGL